MLFDVRAGGFSCRLFCDSALHILSRLDRDFVKVDASFLGGACTAHVLTNHTSTVLEVLISAPSSGGRWRLPPLAAAHPIFIERMTEAIPLILARIRGARRHSTGHAGILKQLKCSSPRGASVFAWQTHWIGAARLVGAQALDEDARRYARRAAGRSSLCWLPDGDVRSELNDDLISGTIRQLRQMQVWAD